jgi:hypothetical protein
MGSAAKMGFIVLVFGIIGMVLALIESMLYDNEYLITAMISSQAELQGLMVVTIIISLLLGSVFAVLTQS